MEENALVGVKVSVRGFFTDADGFRWKVPKNGSAHCLVVEVTLDDARVIEKFLADCKTAGKTGKAANAFASSDYQHKLLNELGC